MTQQLLFYKNAVPLSNTAHRDVSIRTEGAYGFARSVNSVPLVAAEFRAAAVEGTIVFAGAGTTAFPVVILGLAEVQNLFVAEDGRWTGRYLPALIRRYPFVFAAGQEEGALTLCIDTEHDGINTDNEGERLFDSRGERTVYLQGVLDFARDYQAQFLRTGAFCKRLAELGLLEPMQASYTTPAGETRRLNGFSAVNRDRLKALGAETVQQLLQADELEMIFIHLQSLNNLQSLSERLRDRG
ncbi:SapC family protein [Mesobacterium pallidum]|uniref:SapC family protein n=1 Tax=Mesobacterium pallidum TaxID=2872037 RepID=UPI001EE39FC0|nr:SapC family protein [Mesobacterium pallidum]